VTKAAARAASTAAVSVAIATVGRPRDLERCLASLLEGTRRPAQVVVVDQSADRGTEDVVKRAQASGLVVSHHPQPRRGLGVAQNTAVALATEALIAVIDDDCVAGERWLETVESLLAAGVADVLTGSVHPLPIDNDRTLAVSSRTSTEPCVFSSKDAPWQIGSGNNFALGRDWFERIGGCDERLGPGSPGRGGVDMDLFYRLLRAGARIRYEPSALVYHARTTPAERLARRVPYGYGMGACCTLWLRGRDPGGLRILASWFVSRGKLLGRALARRQWLSVWEELLVLGGTARGIVYGLRA
jgi:GT2 family glycosyltransferase